MSPESLERALRDLPRTGQLIKDRPYRQVWRIEIEGRAAYLKFYPRRGFRLKRLFVGNPALREFSRLQLLQKANIPAPRAISVLVGFRIGDQIGDAVLMHAIEPGVTLDRYLLDLELSGKADPRRRQIALQTTQLVQAMVRSGLGHRDLHLGNFLLSEGKIYLLDAYALRRGAMRESDLLMLGHSVRRYATRTELLRGWRQFGGEVLPSANNRTARGFWGKEMSRTKEENRYFGELTQGDWRGFYFKSRKYAVSWATASRLTISQADWTSQWPRLLGQLESQQLTLLEERSRGQVFTGEIVLAGVPVNVIVHRAGGDLSDMVRESRARGAWRKAWSLIVRDIPAAWPLLIMERRQVGRVVEQLVVFEQPAGPTLSTIALNDLTRGQRDQIFSRLGQMLHRMERVGLYHADARAKNVIVHSDPAHGLVPILADVNAIRKKWKTRSSIYRLLADLRESQSAYNPADSYALCRGYAPTARMEKED